MVWAALGACGGTFVRFFGSLWRAFGEFWAFFWDLGPLWGSFGDLWVTFGVPWAGFGIPLDGFGVPLGSLLEALGPFGGARGRLLAPFGLHLGSLRGENVIKVTLGNHWFSIGKTIYFVCLGGPVEAKMAPRRAKMRPHGRKDCKGEAQKGKK